MYSTSSDCTQDIKKTIKSKDGTLLDLVINLRSENFSLIKFRMTKNISQVWCKDCPSVGSNSQVLVIFLFLRLPRDLLETDLSDGEPLEFSTDDTMRRRGVFGQIDPKYGRSSSSSKTLFSAAASPVDG